MVKKRILGFAMVGLVVSMATSLQAVAWTAKVANTEPGETGQRVLVYERERAISLKPGEWIEAGNGDVVVTLSASKATVSYPDDCIVPLGINSRLPIKEADVSVACAKRAELVNQIQLYVQQGLSGAAVTTMRTEDDPPGGAVTIVNGTATPGKTTTTATVITTDENVAAGLVEGWFTFGAIDSVGGGSVLSPAQ